MSNSKYSKIYIACDHGGFDLKSHLLKKFPNLPWQDLGTQSTDSVDYPDYAASLCEKLKSETPGAIGVLVCGSGQGMAIRANRYSYIRAALCWTPEVAKLAREHNDANVLCLAGRLTKFDEAERILETFIKSNFEGGRHQRRVDKLNC